MKVSQLEPPVDVGIARADASREQRIKTNSIVLDSEGAIVRNDCSGLE